MKGQQPQDVLAINPHKAMCHGALFMRGECVSLHSFEVRFAGAASYTFDSFQEPGPELIVLERMFHAPQGHRSPNDLLDVQAAGFYVAGQIAQQCDVPLVTHTPGDWKAQRKKPIHHRALWEKIMYRQEKNLFAIDTHEYIIEACQRYGATGKVTGYERAEVKWLDAFGLGALQVGRTRVGGGAL